MAYLVRPGDILTAKDIVLMRPSGFFLQMEDTVFYVLYCGYGMTGKMRPTILYIRELLTEEISTLVIRGSNYETTYRTPSRRPGAEKTQYKDYSKVLKDPAFKVLDLELNMCLYKGNYVCQDLKTAETYSFVYSTSQMKTELSNLNIGDIVSVCRYQNIDFFVASYKYNDPKIVNFKVPERIILKKGNGFKLTRAQTDKTYWASLLQDFNYKAESKYPPNNYTRHENASNMHICEEAKTAYGYASTFEYDGRTEIIFTDMADYKIYSIPSGTVGKNDFEALKEDTYFMKAYITKMGDCRAKLCKGYQTERLNKLEYLYKEDGVASYMDLDTYELYEIPFRYLPKKIKETDILCGYTAEHVDFKQIDPKGRVYVLNISDGEL